MYFGPYQTVVDDKGRITVPKKFHDLMVREDHITWFITRGYNGNLSLFNKPQWEQLVARAEVLDPLNPVANDYLLMLYGCAIDVRVDNQGRMPVPPQLRSLAGLNRDVLLVGMRDHLELWDKDAWDAFQRERGSDFRRMATEVFVCNETAAERRDRENGVS